MIEERLNMLIKTFKEDKTEANTHKLLALMATMVRNEKHIRGSAADRTLRKETLMHKDLAIEAARNEIRQKTKKLMNRVSGNFRTTSNGLINICIIGALKERKKDRKYLKK